MSKELSLNVKNLIFLFGISIFFMLFLYTKSIFVLILLFFSFNLIEQNVMYKKMDKQGISIVLFKTLIQIAIYFFSFLVVGKILVNIFPSLINFILVVIFPLIFTFNIQKNARDKNIGKAQLLEVSFKDISKIGIRLSKVFAPLIILYILIIVSADIKLGYIFDCIFLVVITSILYLILELPRELKEQV